MDDLQQLLCQLVGIDSTNPDLVPDGKGEREISAYVQHWLQERGIEAQREEFSPGRFNVVARVRGTGGGKTLLLNAHMDVVGTAGMQDPFSPKIENGRLYGRGGYDMKGGLAACMVALVQAKKLALQGDVILTAVADEEYASIGMQHLLKTVTADAAIVTEPTELALCIAHKGFTWHEVTTFGKAAHGSRPDLGVDAIAHMGRVLGKIEKWQGDLKSRTPHPLLGHGSVHASLISGGQELSSYPETCTLQLERRTLPAETPEQVQAELETLLSELQRQDSRFRAEHRMTLHRDGFEVPVDEKMVQVVKQQASEVLGHTPEITGKTFWMESALLQQAGIPTVVFGPAGTGAHATEEWVDLKSVEQCCEVLTRTIKTFCQAEG
ncbi:ArgE/DapE family deacylase [Deinococcus cellulosilyticus]|uniref:Probable succinyl-diaminopimelate desuccinylase n=1 Tax=Deinococcus cellulosilyticus (strain DSM 18568 / NBRC 106333 / KACC 11606 / 5516J-15) TaxID=1223518 RepID=A0A511N249_DEIC1|nr:ArgE/DapE family deacylase [Deinococcus cellulosilyticus]GEM46923.1 acetylornithine deacetylase [Deinococcus cellulosilyticus NBRC 106333 = KACC 11606]